MHVGKQGPLISHLFFAGVLILFAETSISQMQGIREVQYSFYSAFNQKVYVAKTALCFPRNAPYTDKVEISQLNGYSVASSLGKYRGIPLVIGRLKKEYFEQVSLHVLSQLNGWSAEQFSMVGWVIIACSIFQSIPSYVMHVLKFSKYVYTKLEYQSCNFI